MPSLPPGSCRVSFNPLLLALSIDPHHSSYRLLKEGQAFSINVLKKGQLDLAEHFGQPSSTDKLAGQRWTMGRMGLPLLREALAWFECHLVDEHPAGDHMLVLARVIGGKLLDVEAEALSYRETGEMDGSSALFPDVFGD
jgi:flavin reductase (DIM6/NTAB) family NADH-FMN oxidoreductase RutF